MTLVSYSDSETSDIEEAVPKPASTTASKTGFQKVVDRANPHKIRVSLPTSAAAQDNGSADQGFPESDRPTKRVKANGTFSGFSSFLPAPKNPAKAGSGNPSGAKGSVLGGSRGAGLGRGVSLKTGAIPAFSRELPAAEESAFDEEEDRYARKEDGFTHNAPSGHRREQVHVQDEVKLVGKPMMFKPLSVARRPAKKKATEPPASSNGTAMPVPAHTGPAGEVLQNPAMAMEEKVVVKKSLFSSYTDDTTPIHPFLTASIPHEDPQPESYVLEQSPPQHQPTPAVPAVPSGQATNLEVLANNLGLSAAERRHLFGRGGVSKDAQVASFSLAAEYSSNRRLIETDANAVPVLNPVKGIAPGKHSLQQLVSAAANQRDALEESFASGRRKKADAGSRYGW